MKCMLLTVGFLLTANGFAETRTWVQTAGGVFDWVTSSNWQDGQAAASGEEAVFPAAVAAPQTVQLPTNDAWTFGELAGGGEDLSLAAPARVGARGNTISTPHTYTFGPLSAYLGGLLAGDSRQTFVFPESSTLARLSSTNTPTLDVTSSLTVGTLTSGGIVRKKGAGALTVQNLSAPDCQPTRLAVSAGALSVGSGTPQTTFPTGVAGDPYVHFDMADESSLTTVVGEDGRTYVTEWADVRRNGLKAVVPTKGALINNQAPFLSKDLSFKGHPWLDFGAFGSNSGGSNPTGTDGYAAAVAEYGPTGVLAFPASDKIRTVFVVFCDIKGASNWDAFPLGSVGNAYHYHRQSSQMWNNSASANVKNGVTRIDGTSIDWNSNPDLMSAPRVLSVETTGDTEVSALGDDRTCRAGGVRIAEVVLYTNVLTCAECDDTIAWLRAKWQGVRPEEDDLRALEFTGATPTLEVPGEGELKVGTLVAADRSLEKSGAGKLTVGEVTPVGLSLRVAAGSVAFAESDVVFDSPADDAAFWIDATVDDSFDFESGDDRTYVSRWRDRRGVDFHFACRATNVNNVALCPMPYTASWTVNGEEKRVIDFGPRWWRANSETWPKDAGESTYLALNKPVQTIDGFIVLKMHDKAASAYSPPLFGGNGRWFLRFNGTEPLSKYADYATHAAEWQCDGLPFDPNVNYDFGTTSFRVIDFSSSEPIPVDQVAGDRKTEGAGGLQIAEMILYRHRLSEAERKRTQAYLMNKWCGKPHPGGTGRNLSAIELADGLEAKTDVAGGSVRATSFVTDSDTFVKTGAGKLETRLADNVTKLDVRGGALTIGAPVDDAFIHIAADETDSLTTRFADNGDGTVTTNVIRMMSLNANGHYADAEIVSKANAMPTLATVETAAGKTMPVVDFGDYFITGKTGYPADMGTSMPPTNSASAFNFDQECVRAREAHIIYADRPGSRRASFIFGSSTTYHYHRYYKADNCTVDQGGGMFNGLKNNNVANGSIAVDGQPQTYSYSLPTGFHHITVVPDGDTTIGSLCNDRDIRRGGAQVGELLVFEHALSSARHDWLVAHLRHKWFGVGDEPVYTNAYESIEMANGTSLAFAPGQVVTAESFSAGGGTLSATEISGLNSLVFEIRTMEDFDSLKVSGRLNLAATGTLDITFAEGLKPWSNASLTLLSATELGDFDLSAWQVTMSGETRKVPVLTREGDAIVLTFRPKGLVFVVR